VILSFAPSVLKRVRQLEPLVMTGFLFSDPSLSAVATSVDAGARQLLPRIDCVTRQLVNEAHANDLKVVAWTANVVDEMHKLISAGVDGIITNYPDRLVDLLRTSQR
jgi:glycerophosphoryl diester phosphodiesterase